MDKLAEQIRNDLVRIEKADNEWVEGTLSLCQHLLEARNKHPNNNKFGDWLKSNKLAINEHDREALLHMAHELTLTKIVLQETKRKSYQYIWREEIKPRSAYVSGTRDNVIISEKKHQRVTPKLDAARKIVREKLESNEPIIRDKISNEHNIPNWTVANAIVAEKARLEAKEEIRQEAENPPYNREEWLKEVNALSNQSEKKRLLKLDKTVWSGFDEAVSKRCQKWADESGISFFMKRIDSDLQMFNNPRNAVMYKTEYNIILRALHPDTGHTRTKEQMEEAFRIFTRYKFKMINDAEERENAIRALHSSMPKTLAEMMARRKNK